MRRGKTNKPDLCPECGEELYQGTCPRYAEREREEAQKARNREYESQYYQEATDETPPN